MGASEILFERFVPMGQSRPMHGAALDAKEWFRAVEEIVALAGEDVSPLELLAFRAFRLFLDGPPHLSGALCNLGDESMALMPNGDIYPCRRYNLRVADIAEKPFAEILEILSTFNTTQRKASLNGAVCAPCPEPGCTGCRALCHALGDARSDDPQCALRR